MAERETRSRQQTRVVGMRFSIAFLDKLDKYAETRGLSRTALVVEAVDAVLAGPSATSSAPTPTTPAGGAPNVFIDGKPEGDDDFSGLPEFSSRLEADKHARDNGYPQARARAAWKAQREKLKR